MKCPKCQAEGDSNARFCTKCGYCLAAGTTPHIICPKCRSVMTQDSKFCTKCRCNLAIPIRHDPIEDMYEYKEILARVDKLVDKKKEKA